MGNILQSQHISSSVTCLIYSTQFVRKQNTVLRNKSLMRVFIAIVKLIFDFVSLSQILNCTAYSWILFLVEISISNSCDINARSISYVTLKEHLLKV